MKGEILAVWPYVWSDVWVRLYETRGAPVELFSELFSVLISKPQRPVAPNEPLSFDDDGNMTDPVEITAASDYKTAVAKYDERRLSYERAMTASPEEARAWLRDALHTTLVCEADAIHALETAFRRIEDIGGDSLSNRYVNLVEAFIEKYNLKYDLRRPFSLHSNLLGVFSYLVGQLKSATAMDPHLHGIMSDFEDSFRDLKAGDTPARIKACITRQLNLLEAIGQIAPNVTGKTLGAICDQVGTWPHEKLKDSIKCIYKFSNEYPGVRHAGTPETQIREIDVRDLIAVSVVLTGFAPYLTDRIDLSRLFG